MSLIVKVGKAGKRVVKKFLPEEKHHVSYTRRIERVKTRERVVAMTFDDGPMDLPSSPDKFDGKALTDILLDTLGEYGAQGTFDVVGDTSENYPDTAGKSGQADWGGVRYDHYPDINQDERGGAVHNQRLYGLNAKDGSLLWTVEAAEPVLGAVTIADGRAYIGASDATFRAIDIHTGKG